MRLGAHTHLPKLFCCLVNDAPFLCCWDPMNAEGLGFHGLRIPGFRHLLCRNYTGLADGSYTFSLRALDASGDPGPTVPFTFVSDTTPPAVSALALSQGGTALNGGPLIACRGCCVHPCHAPCPLVKDSACTSMLLVLCGVFFTLNPTPPRPPCPPWRCPRPEPR